jgi:predicted RecA/RadA family phage recombinase
MKKTVFLLSLMVFVGALLACGASDNNTGSAVSSTPSSSSPSAKSSQAPASATHFKVGQVVKVGDTWQVTVNSVKTSQGDDMDKPQKGQYLLLDVSVKNISSQEQNISSLANFKLTDDTGISYTEAITALGNPNPPDGKVEAGSPLRGTFTYDVPTSVKKFTFSFEPDIMSSGQTIWDINV